MPIVGWIGPLLGIVPERRPIDATFGIDVGIGGGRSPRRHPEIFLESSHRIRLARRQARLSQQQLARLVGVGRAAVSQWESVDGKNPRVKHLRALAIVTNVQFEWLATGRGTMHVHPDLHLDSVAAASGALVDDDTELRLLRCFRSAPARARVALLDLAEAVVASKTRRGQTLPAT